MIYGQDFLADIVKEKKFIQAIRKDGRFPKELEVMIEIYRKMLEGLVTLRFDVEIYSRLLEDDPDNLLVLPDKTGQKTSWADSLKVSEITLQVREKVIAVIREHLIVKYEEIRKKDE